MGGNIFVGKRCCEAYVVSKEVGKVETEVFSEINTREHVENTTEAFSQTCPTHKGLLGGQFC